uniref:Uncharacterized protein n=1 Tax=Arundo donax TaxID=35708 RepID=A0A0A9E9P6_ARUDO
MLIHYFTADAARYFLTIWKFSILFTLFIHLVGI